MIKITAADESKIEKLAASGVNQKEIAIEMGFSHPLFQSNKKIRTAWEKGNNSLKLSVKASYIKLVKSSECWPAMKHFLATQCNMVEPKTPEIVVQPLEAIRFIDDTKAVDARDNESC